MNEVIREFLIESHENLAQLDLDLVSLEKDPREGETLARVFRTLHTVKGTAGFLGLQRLQAVSHAAENLLSRLRDGALIFNPTIASALLAVVDAIRRMLASVEARETDGDEDFAALIENLERLRSGVAAPAPVASAPAGAVPPGSAPAIPAAAPVPPAAVTAPRSGVRAETRSEAARPGSVSSAPFASPPSVTGAEAQRGSGATTAEPAEARTPAVADSAIRVDVGLLDKLMTLVGELVLARNQVMQFSTSQEDGPFVSTVKKLNLLTSELQAGVMKTRMQPISTIWSKFPRVVRDLAVACGKQARLEMEGQDTELDKTIIEAIRDPLTHLVRNAVDHGIEAPAQRVAHGKPAEGRLALYAFHEGGKVVIEIADDGGGIDPQRVRARAIQAKLVTPEQADRLNDQELLNFIFLPGFSTAEKVTQFSGRGVGMDVVRTNIEKIGGTVNIESRSGQGTTVKMKIPLTLAIIPALTVTSDGDRYAIPQVSLQELVRLEGEQAQRGIEWIHGAPVYRLRGNLLPLVDLKQQLANEPKGAISDERETVNIVVLQADDRAFGLIVDAIHDTEEIVVKPLQKQLKALSVFSGATIMGDGKVALILDVLGVAQRGNVVCGVRERALSEKPVSTVAPTADRQTVLVFAARDGGRMAIPLSLVDRLEEFRRTALERVGPVEVVQYRGEILPLIDVTRALQDCGQRKRARRSPRGRRAAPPPNAELPPVPEGDTVQVVVHAGETRRVGLVVGRIIDIAEQTLVSRSAAERPGVLFNAVVQGRVTEFLDLAAILGTVDPDVLEQPQRVAAEA